MKRQLTLGGRPLPRALDDIRRYCGLAWSGGESEVFAYAYFDTLEQRREDDIIRPVDVLSTSALHPSFTKRDLTYFITERSRLGQELAQIPRGVDLADAGPELVDRLVALPDRLRPTCGLALLTKVLHAKRPRLVPMLDRALTERYRHVTGQRGEQAWGRCVRLLAEDLAEEDNIEALQAMQGALAAELPHGVPSTLRLADIAIWMAVNDR